MQYVSFTQIAERLQIGADKVKKASKGLEGRFAPFALQQGMVSIQDGGFKDYLRHKAVTTKGGASQETLTAAQMWLQELNEPLEAQQQHIERLRSQREEIDFPKPIAPPQRPERPRPEPLAPMKASEGNPAAVSVVAPRNRTFVDYLLTQEATVIGIALLLAFNVKHLSLVYMEIEPFQPESVLWKWFYAILVAAIIDYAVLIFVVNGHKLVSALMAAAQAIITINHFAGEDGHSFTLWIPIVLLPAMIGYCVFAFSEMLYHKHKQNQPIS